MCGELRCPLNAAERRAEEHQKVAFRKTLRRGQGSPSFSQFSNVMCFVSGLFPPAADLLLLLFRESSSSLSGAPPPSLTMSSSNLNAASPSRVVRRSTSEHAEPLRFEHQNILKKIHLYGRLADTTAAKPADLQRRMAAMEAEQEAERERLEDARRRAQSDGESIVAQLEIAKLENAGLRDQLEIARAENAQARRSVEVSIEKQVDLKRDLQSALSELETLRLELSLLRPYEVKPLPAAAAQLENPELQPPPRSVSTGPGASPRGGGSSMGACARPSTAYGHTGAGSAHGQQRPGMRRTDARTLSPEPEPNPSPHPNPNPNPSPSPCPTDSLTLTRT